VSVRAFAGAIALTLLAVVAANAARPRIAVIGPAEEPRFTDVVRGLGEGLGEQGRESASVDVIEKRVPRGERPAAEGAVAKALRARPDVLFIVGSVLARVARDASADVPIVFITPGDPVAAGLAASFRQPGRNMTAVTFEYPELAGKRLEIRRARPSRRGGPRGAWATGFAAVRARRRVDEPAPVTHRRARVSHAARLARRGRSSRGARGRVAGSGARPSARRLATRGRRGGRTRA
jgi:hypothetical protein